MPVGGFFLYRAIRSGRLTTSKKQPRYSQTRKKRTFFSPMPTRSWGVLPIRNANLPQRGSSAVLRSAEERQRRESPLAL